MSPPTLLGLALGVGIGLANALASLALYGWARRQTGNGFIHVILGGMAVRLPLAALAVALVLILTDVAALPFVSALMAAFVIGLFLEAWIVLRDARIGAEHHPPPSSS